MVVLITDFSVEFKKERKGKIPEVVVELDNYATLKRDAFTLGMELGSYKGGSGSGFTAGLSTVENIRRASIATETIFPTKVLMRDAFCLVHRERDDSASLYQRFTQQ